MKGGYKYTKRRICRSPQLIGLKRFDAKTRNCKPTRKRTKTKTKTKTKKRYSKNKKSKKRKSSWYKRN